MSSALNQLIFTCSALKAVLKVTFIRCGGTVTKYAMAIRLIHIKLALQIGPVAIKDLPLSFLASVDKVALESVSVVVHYFCWTI